jgi:hypothetical protein
MATAAGTGPERDDRMQFMLRQRMAQEQQAKEDELRKLQLDALRKQAEQADKAQGKDDITGAMIQSMNLQVADAVQRLRSSVASKDMAGAEKARSELEQLKSPEYQDLLRGHLATQGNVGMAEQAGMIDPLQPPATPTSKMREYEFARQNGYEGSFTDFMQVSGAAGGTPGLFAPTVVRNPDGSFSFVQAGNQPGMQPVVNPLTGSPVGSDPALQGAIAGARAGGKMTAESDAQALSDLPTVEASAAEMDTLLSELAAHPGKSQAVGARSMLPVIPGSPTAGFVARLEQVQGKAFLQAYESLKGGGAITEIEGKKAEQAIGRLSRAQSEEDFNQAISDLQDVVAVGVSRARRRAQQAQARQPSSISAGPVPNSSPAQSQSAPPSSGWGIVRKN